MSRAEYDLLASLPAGVLSKTRFSVPPLGIDALAGVELGAYDRRILN